MLEDMEQLLETWQERRDIAESERLTAQWGKNLLLANSHGGTVYALNDCMKELEAVIEEYERENNA